VEFSRVKNNSTYVFLVLFLLMKMAGFHAFSHTEDKEHAEYCAICDYAMLHHTTPTILPEEVIFEIKKIAFFVQKEIAINNNGILATTIIPRALFSRPPPFIG